MNPIAKFVDLFSRVEPTPDKEQVSSEQQPNTEQRIFAEPSVSANASARAAQPARVRPEPSLSYVSLAVFAFSALVAGGLVGVSLRPVVWGLTGLSLFVVIVWMMWEGAKTMNRLWMLLMVLVGTLLIGFLVGLGMAWRFSPEQPRQLTKADFMALGLNEQEATTLLIYQKTGLAPSGWLDTSAAGYFNKMHPAPEAQVAEETPEDAKAASGSVAPMPIAETDTTDSAQADMVAIELARCADIMLDQSMGSEQLAFAFQQGGKKWGDLAAFLQKLVDEEDFPKVIRQVYAGICQVEGDSLLAISNCAAYAEANSQSKIADALRQEGAAMAQWVKAMDGSDLKKQQRFDVYRAMVKAFCEEQ